MRAAVFVFAVLLVATVVVVLWGTPVGEGR